MFKLHEGQCGLCAHFGEHSAKQDTLVQIRVNGEAPADLVEPCGHPKNEGLHLKVSPIAGCDGFEPAKQ
ncbi:MAG: hypothetical protein AAFR38_08000 [Planctomycetota bacterium]